MGDRFGTSRSKLWWIVGGAAAVVLGLGVMSRVHAGPFRHHARTQAELEVFMQNASDHLLDAVDADEAQRARIDGLISQRAPETFALLQEGRALRQELKAALLSEQIDPARVEAAKQKLDVWAQRSASFAVDGFAGVAGVLTPAQRAQVADKLARMHH
jgi:Spy/CpxP family protein refolding chaperone